MYPPFSRRSDIRPRPRSFTFSGVRWNLPRRSSWACVVSTRTSRPSSIGVAFVAAVHNYSRRDYLVDERGGPGSSFARRGSIRRIGGVVRWIHGQSRPGYGNMARSAVLNRGVLTVTLSLRWGSRRVEEGGLTPMTCLDPTGVCTCERHEGSVHPRMCMCALATVHVHTGREGGMNAHGRANSRAHAHHEGVVHLNRGGWYTHAAGVGWFLRRILASPVIARNEVKLTAYTPSLLRFWMPRRFARTLRPAFVRDAPRCILDSHREERFMTTWIRFH